MIKHLKFSYMTFALVFSSEFVGKVVSAPFWGRHSDNIVYLQLIKKVSYLIPLVPLLWLASSNVIYLVGVQFFSGVVWAGFDICSRSLVYTVASPGKRAGYIVYKRSLLTMCQALGALSGAGILGFMIPVMGQKILGMFLLSGILRFALAKTMLPNMRVAANPPEDFSGDGSDKKSAHDSQEPGLENSGQPQQPIIRATHLATTNTTSVPLRRGLYYHNKDETARHDSAPQAYLNAITTKRGLYYRPSDWADYVRQSRSKYRTG